MPGYCTKLVHRRSKEKARNTYRKLHIFGDTVFDQLATISQYISPGNISSIITIVATVFSIFGYIIGKSNVVREKIKVRYKILLLLIKVKFLNHRKHVYIYTDCDGSSNITTDIVEELAKKSSQYHFEPVDQAEDLQWVPRHQSVTRAIIVINTDVSQFSSNEKTRVKIQEDLLEFARSGGVLILGHDVLYRRTKNKILTKAMGCELTKFERRDKKLGPSDIKTIENSEGWVCYKKNPDIKNSKLPSNFMFKDNEVVTCEAWVRQIEESDIFPIYTEEKTGYILVAKKKCSKGCIFWINSGDHTADAPPKSLKIYGEFTIANLLTYLIENKDLEVG